MCFTLGGRRQAKHTAARVRLLSSRVLLHSAKASISVAPYAAQSFFANAACGLRLVPQRNCGTQSEQAAFVSALPSSEKLHK